MTGWPARPTPLEIQQVSAQIVSSAELSSPSAKRTAVSATGSGAGSVVDPYDSPGEREEGCFVGVFVSGILAKFGLIDVDGFCSTYREWHIFLAGIWAGVKAPQLADIPDCPEYWQDEMQYYTGGAIVSNVAKIYGTAGLAALTGAGLAINYAEVLQIVHTLQTVLVGIV